MLTKKYNFVFKSLMDEIDRNMWRSAFRTGLPSAGLMLKKAVRNNKRREIFRQKLHILIEWYLALSEKKIQPRSRSVIKGHFWGCFGARPPQTPGMRHI